MTKNPVARQYAQMHQNLFKTTADNLKYLIYDNVPAGLAICSNAVELVFAMTMD
jgi:hypothetical protein